MADADTLYGAARRRTVLDPEAMRRLVRMAKLARLMDTALRVPGTNIRFGADSIMGLLPVAGDAAGVVAPSSGEGIYYAMVGGRVAAYFEKVTGLSQDSLPRRIASNVI